MSVNKEAAQEASSLQQALNGMLADVGLDLVFADKRPAPAKSGQHQAGFDPTQIQSMLRHTESTRGYSDWPSVGTEPVVDFLHKLATVKSRSQPFMGDRLPHIQGVLDNEMLELTGWLKAQKIKLPFEILASIYPTGQLNARAVPVAGRGALLLVNAGLMDLIFMLLKINIALPTPNGAPPLLTEERAERALAEVFNAYLYGSGSLGAWKLPRLPAAQEFNLGFVLRRAEQFVLAHEIGHVVLGHIDHDDTQRLHAGHYTPEQENEADSFAVKLLVEAHKRIPNWQASASYLAGAIMTFFAIAEVLRALETSFGLSTASAETHPSTTERSNRVAAQLNALMPLDGLLGPASVFTAWLIT
jgi:Peptidase U49